MNMRFPEERNPTAFGQKYDRAHKIFSGLRKKKKPTVDLILENIINEMLPQAGDSSICGSLAALYHETAESLKNNVAQGPTVFRNGLILLNNATTKEYTDDAVTILQAAIETQPSLLGNPESFRVTCLSLFSKGEKHNDAFRELLEWAFDQDNSLAGKIIEKLPNNLQRVRSDRVTKSLRNNISFVVVTANRWIQGQATRSVQMDRRAATNSLRCGR